MKKTIALLLALLLALNLFAAAALAEEEEESLAETFAEWNPEAPALKTLIDYVEDVTDDQQLISREWIREAVSKVGERLPHPKLPHSRAGK